jgi:hypothetical protein
MAQRPVAIGLLLCEQAIIQEGTRNVTLVNCFRDRVVRRIPSELFSFLAAAFLADGEGELPMEVFVQSLDNLEVIYRRSFRYRFLNPLREARLLLRVSHCVFPVAGPYQVVLTADAEMVAHSRLHIASRGP